VIDVTVAWFVPLSVCLYVVCHTRALAKAVGWNEMPFGRNTCGPSNIVLDRGPGPHAKERFGGRNSEPPVRSDAAYRQIALKLVFITTINESYSSSNTGLFYWHTLYTCM